MSEPSPALFDAIVERDSRQSNPDRAPWQFPNLSAAQSDRCALCLTPFADERRRPIADPVIPGEVGGPLHLADNFALLCSSCAQKRAHRDLLDLGLSIPPALAAKRSALWEQYIPHHLTALGRGRSSQSYRRVLQQRATHARVPWVVAPAPGGWWIGHARRCPDGPGRAAHLRLVAEHGAIRRWETPHARVVFAPSGESASIESCSLLWALIEAGAYLIPASPELVPTPARCASGANAWPVHLISLAAQRRRCQEPDGVPFPPMLGQLSGERRARNRRTQMRKQAVVRWRAEAEAARTRWREASGNPRVSRLIVDALFVEWERLDARLVSAQSALLAEHPEMTRV